MKKIYSSRLFLGMLFATIATSLQAQTATVTSPTDGLPGSLRNTIATANAGDTILFAPITDNIVQVLVTGEIVIDKALVILGNDSNLTKIGGVTSRIFNITSADSVIISGITFQDGLDSRGGAITADNTILKIRSSAFLNNIADTIGGALNLVNSPTSITQTYFMGNIANGIAANEGGGAIANSNALLDITNATFSNNSALGASGSGGAVLNLAAGNLTVRTSVFNSNTAMRAGGAIESNSGAGSKIILENDTCRGNTTGSAPGNGGALHLTGPIDADVIGGVYSGNVAAAEGGALWNGAGTMLVSGVLLERNIANGAAADQGGGAIYNLSGTLDINTNSILRGNIAGGASGSGGGILNDVGATLIVSNSAIVGNISSRAGGGIEDNSGAATTITMMNVVLDSNVTASAPGNGGGLHITGAGNLAITGGTVSVNSANQEGGGLWNGSGTMTITGTLIENNLSLGAASHDGGSGVFNNGGTLNILAGTIVKGNIATGSSASGGGLLSLNGAVTITGASFESNSANRAGGAIEIIDGTLTVSNSDFINNDVNGTAGAPNPGNGGVLHISGVTTASFMGGTATGNTAAREGGALWNQVGSTLTVDGGFVMDSNSANGPAADDGGGAIFNNGGALVLNAAILSNNQATGAAGSGGGVFNATGGTITGTGVTIIKNRAIRAGGAIEDASNASLKLISAILDSNTVGATPGNGGAIHVSGSSNVTLTGGTVNGNVATSEGGGLWNGSGVMTVSGVTIKGNRASGAGADQGGGGIYNLSGALNVLAGSMITDNIADGLLGSGGGILNDVGAALNVISSTIANNSAVRAGGGIEDNSGAASIFSLTDVTLTGNSTAASPGNGGAVHITGAGNLKISNSIVDNNTASAEGGGLWNGSGTMEVIKTSFSGNIASGAGSDQGGGALFNQNGNLIVSGGSTFTGNMATGAAGSGGAIMNDVGSFLSVTASAFTANQSMRAGGAIEDNSGASTTVQIKSSTFTSNTTGNAPGNGGAIHITGMGNMTVDGSVFTNNTAAKEGGALWNSVGDMFITNSHITNNTANGNAADDGGAGVFNNGGKLIIDASSIIKNNAAGTNARGGGILSVGSGQVAIMRSTLSGNSAFDGGAFSASAGSSISSSTIVNNTATSQGGGIYQSGVTVSLSGNIIALNTATNGNNLQVNAATITSGGYNLIGKDDAAVFTPLTGDTEGTNASPIDPLIDVLASNGGITFGHKLKCGSPAIDMGNPTNVDTDQFGLAVFGTKRDIGALELQTVCVSIAEANKQVVLQLYPNPATSGIINIANVDGNYTQLKIYQIQTGSLVRDLTIETGSITVDINELTNGVYSAVAIGENQRAVSKFVVIK